MQSLQPNSTLQGGKYKIISVLGQGGFGITYLAEQVMLGRKVAIKEFFMKELCNRDEETSQVSIGSAGSIDMVNRFKEKFLKEARLIATMEHHHIVKIHDIFEENGTAYYIMENIDGGSVDGLVKNGALKEDDALKIIKEVGSALEYIHKQNVLHLDVKPSNILLRKNGEAVLIDFGISKRYDSEGGQTSTTPTGISKGYAPIEQYNQGLQNFTPATDVYSLGATLYKLLTGQTPPEASLLLNDEELTQPNNIAISTWNAIEHAMEPRIKKRPQSITEFLSILGDSKPVPSTKEEVVFDETTQLVSQNVIEEVPVKAIILNATEFEANGIKFNMMKVEGGTFNMKEEVSSGFFGLSTKEVTQNVQLSDYWIGETQVTQALWKAVMGKNPSFFKGDQKPVETVSWNSCQEFIKRLNDITGKQFRLPTEAEWEFAARGGNKGCREQYYRDITIDTCIWSLKDSNNKTHDVATKQANELGIYDMRGNVCEWCNDWYGNYTNSKQVNPTGPKSGEFRVNRGGSWHDLEKLCSSTYRFNLPPSSSSNDLGLRLALSM